MKNIGIVCEGPTDYMILRGVIDKITNEDNHYIQLQPEPDLTGEYGNGWKGVWKWCRDNAGIKDKLMKDIKPQLDILIIQMDGDVSRKEKAAHCWHPEKVLCLLKGSVAIPILAAGIMNVRYVNGMPLARQEREFSRYDLKLSTCIMYPFSLSCS